MDVKLPDGTIIKDIPDGMSKADLTAKLAKNGYDVSKLMPAPDVNAIPGQGANINKPGFDSQGRMLPTPAAPANTEGILARAAGAGEALLATGTGMLGGAAGAVAGIGKAALKKITTGEGSSDAEVDKTVSDVAGALTYQPRTQTGANLAQLAGRAIEGSGIAGLAAPELNAAAHAVGNASRYVRGAAGATAATQNAADAAAAAVPGPSLRDLVRAPAPLAGVGAAEVSPVTVRAQRAASLPVPIKLTAGQATRDRQQVAFERETAKQKEGAPLAAAYEQQNAALGQNLDAAVDETGAANVTPRSVGKSVVAALEAKQQAKKADISGLYQQARDAGEMQQPVDVSGLVDWIAKNKGKDKLAPIVSTIESELKQNGKVQGGGADPLTLAQRPSRTTMTLDASEDLRQAINKLAEPGTPNAVFGKEAKGLIDTAQEGKGGDLFKQARRAYENYSNEFTNRDVIDKTLRTKPGTKDRAVAYEDVFNHSIMNGSADDVRHVFRVLTAHPADAAPEVVAAGQQAAADLRGAVINHIKDEMQKNLNVDSTGARTGSPAKIDAIVRELDKDGKLDTIFGKQGAQKVRDLRDTAIDIYTSPSGTVNSSNTTSALMRQMDNVVSYAAGTPVIGKALNYSAQAIKSAGTRRKVRAALEPNLSDLAGKGKN